MCVGKRAPSMGSGCAPFHPLPSRRLYPSFLLSFQLDCFYSVHVCACVLFCMCVHVHVCACDTCACACMCVVHVCGLHVCACACILGAAAFFKASFKLSLEESHKTMCT